MDYFYIINLVDTQIAATVVRQEEMAIIALTIPCPPFGFTPTDANSPFITFEIELYSEEEGDLETRIHNFLSPESVSKTVSEAFEMAESSDVVTRTGTNTRVPAPYGMSFTVH